MLYGARGRRGPSASGSATAGTPTRNVNVVSKSAKEPVNALLSKRAVFKCPPRFEQLLRTAPQLSKAKGGLSGQYAWMAYHEENSKMAGEGIKIAWCKYGRDVVPQEGVMLISVTKSLDDLRSVAFYHASKDGNPIPSMAVADSNGLAIHRLNSSGENGSMFSTWEDLEIKAGDSTILDVQPGGYILGCNERGLVFALHDTAASDSLDLNAWLEKYSVPPPMSNPIQALTSFFSGSGRTNTAVRAMVVSRRGLGFGQEFDVFTLTATEVLKCHVATGVGVGAEVLYKSRTSLEGGGKFLDMKMQKICGSEGRWSDTRLIVLSTKSDACSIILHFLALSDLATLRMEQFPAVPDLFSGSLSEDDLQLLPLTCTAARPNIGSRNPAESPNIHVTDGKRLFTIRCDSGSNEWHQGPNGRIFGWLSLEEDCKRQAELLVLMSEAIYVIQPTEEEEIQARAAFDDGGLLRTLQSSVGLDPETIFYNLEQNRIIREHLQGIVDEWRSIDAGVTEPEPSVCVALLGALRQLVVDREMDSSYGDVLDRRLCERFIQESEQRFNDYIMAINALLNVSDYPILHQGLTYFYDRLRSVRALFEEAKLSPGTLLSDAIEAFVSRNEGENRLRPWATAWRTFCGSVSKADMILAEVCLCLKRKADEYAMQITEQEQVVQYFMEGASLCESFSKHLLALPRPFPQIALPTGDAFFNWSRDVYFPTPLLPKLSLEVLPPMVELAFLQCQSFRRSGIEGRALLESRYLQLQQLHLRLLRQLGTDGPNTEFENRRRFYVESWAPEILNIQANRITLAEEFEDVDALVHISLHDLSHGGRELKERFEREGVWKPDDWAARFGPRSVGSSGAESYATLLFRGLCEIDVKELWDPPFRTYDYVDELLAFVARRGSDGASRGWATGSLRWVMDLRSEELCRRVGRHDVGGGGPQAAAARQAHEARLGRVVETCRELAVERSAVAPDVHCARALLGVAGLAVESLRRSRGSPATRPPRDVAAGLLAARVQATTLRRGGGDDRPAPTPLSLEGTVRECIDRARVTGPSAESEPQKRRLLRDAMALLGQWDLGSPGAAGLSPVWRRLFNEALEAAAAVADRELNDELWAAGNAWDAVVAVGEDAAAAAEERQMLVAADVSAGQTGQRFDQRLCHEALHGAGPEEGGWDIGAGVAGGRLGAWPRDTIQYAFLVDLTRSGQSRPS